MLIECIKPNLTRTKALSRLGGPVREMRRGRLQSVISFYIPYKLFQVSIKNAGNVSDIFAATDAVTGLLDLYRFDDPPVEKEREQVDTENVAATRISEARAFEMLEEKIRREVYMKGFYRVKALEIKGRYLEILYIPYWVGLYGRDEQVRLDVINALNSRFEGAKLKEIIVEWFHSTNAPVAGANSG